MGMAASQARYLEITARKTNVEYAGQQINQQRTELANQSAGLFNQLMALQVPTAPSSTDYTTTQYSFTDGSDNTYTITNMKDLTGNANYNKQVTYYTTRSVYTGISKNRADLGVTGSGTTADPYWFTDGTGTTVKESKLMQCSASDSDYSTESAAINQIITDLGNNTNFARNYASSGISGIYRYTAADGITYYYCNTDLAAAAAVNPPGTKTSVSGYYATNLDKKQYTTTNAYVKTTDSGRYSDIQLEGYSTSFGLNAKTTTNENAYNDAINEYTYQQAIYQQQVTNINAKTSIIQQEDRTLELQLKQLDTEQQALSTEMDSVKKVIDKNIEQTFKTFSS